MNQSPSTGPNGAADSSDTNDTGDTGTRTLGVLCLLGFVLVLVLAFGLSEPDDEQNDLVRIMYVHVPSAILSYTGFVVGALASGFYLWKKSLAADLLAHASIEVGVLFGVLTIITGAIWGQPTWGTYWDWGDVRLVSMLVLVLLYVGYLALRGVGGDVNTRARRSAVVAIGSAAMIPIVRYSVNWWENRTLHQQASLTDGKLEDLTLFTLMTSIVVFLLFYAWLTTKRFRLGWLEHQVTELGLDEAIAQRRAEARTGVDAALGTSPHSDTVREGREA